MPRSLKPDKSSDEPPEPVQLSLPLDAPHAEKPPAVPLSKLFASSARGLALAVTAETVGFNAEQLARRVATSRNLSPRQRNSMTAIRNAIRVVLLKPFARQYGSIDSADSNVAPWLRIFPHPLSELENRAIWLKAGEDQPLLSLISDRMTAAITPGITISFPFYVYDPDGSNRQENITDWALVQLRDRYADDSIGKWDIFYYVYGLLHHPGYHAKYANSLKRELPRIPFAPDFHAFADAGFRLAELHLYYDAAHIVTPYPLEYVWTKQPPSWRVEKMRLSKDKTALVVNDTLTLQGIPPEAYDYQLGNRSALEWVIDQYRVKTDKRSGVTSDPNRADDEQSIVNLVRQVVAVSVETVALVAALPAFE